MSAVGFIKKRCRALSLGRAKASREESPKPPAPNMSFMTPTTSTFDRSSNGTAVGGIEDARISMTPGNKVKAEVVRYNDPRMQANYDNWKQETDNIFLDKQTERALVHQKFQANMVNLCAEYSQQISDIEDRTGDRLSALTLQHARGAAKSQQPLRRKTALLDHKYSYLPPGRRTSTEIALPRTPASASATQVNFSQHSQRIEHVQTFQQAQYIQQYQHHRHQSQIYPESARTYSDAYYPQPDATPQSQIIEITDDEYMASTASQTHGVIVPSSNAAVRLINPRHIKPTAGSPPPPPPATLSSRNLSTKPSNISSWSYHTGSQQLNQAYQHYPHSITSTQRPHTSSGYAYSAYSQSGYVPSEYTVTQKSVSRVSRTSRNIRANEFGHKV